MVYGMVSGYGMLIWHVIWHVLWHIPSTIGSNAWKYTSTPFPGGGLQQSICMCLVHGVVAVVKWLQSGQYFLFLCDVMAMACHGHGASRLVSARGRAPPDAWGCAYGARVGIHGGLGTGL